MRVERAKLIFERKIRPKLLACGDCLLFTGAKGPSGYGRISVHYVHIITYLAVKGDYDRDLEVQHSCNNRACCNPDHLKTGTHKENQEYMSDCKRVKGGQPNSSGMKGVYWNRRLGIWQALGFKHGHRTHLYNGNDFSEACQARKVWETGEHHLKGNEA